MLAQPEEIDSRNLGVYARVSTDEQAREGLSLDEQKDRLEYYCHAMGWKQSIRFFIDNGYSAKDLERPQLQALLKEVKENRISKVIVTKLDRLSRKLKDLLNLIDLFQSHKVSFISVSESFDTNTPSGRLTLQVLGAVAEFERERIRERVIDNMFHAANKGQWLTQPPYGFQLEDKKLIIKDTEAKIVQRIFDLYLNEKMGFYAIAKLFNEEGIPSPSGKEWYNRTIKLMLTNPAYMGTTIWNRQNGSTQKREIKELEKWVIHEETHEAIIEQETWDKVQNRITKKSLPARSQRSQHLLSGFLKCSLCGSGMSYDRAGSKNNKYGVYRCSANKNKGVCSGKVYRSKELELLFKESLQQLSEEFTLEFSPSIRPTKEVDTNPSTQQKIYAAKKRYQRKIEAYTIGLIELKDLQVEKDRYDQLVNTLKKTEINKVNPKEIEYEITSKLKTIVHAIDQLPIPKAKELIKELVDRIVVKEEDDIEIHLKIE